jgi:hypothetical protein
MAYSGTFTTTEILDAFDFGAKKHRFPVFDGGEEYLADARITAYREANRWAVVFEKLSFSGSSPGHWGIVTAMFKFGNCVSGKQGDENWDRVQVTADGPESPAFLPPFGLEVDPNVRTIRIRGKVVAVDLSLNALRRKGIPLPRASEVTYLKDDVLVREAVVPTLKGQQLLWSLLPEHRDLLLATEEEKRRRLPVALPCFLQLEQWNHPRLITDGLKPSDSEAFRMLAEALVAGNPEKYHPKLPPNTKWQNWLAQ